MAKKRGARLISKRGEHHELMEDLEESLHKFVNKAEVYESVISRIFKKFIGVKSEYRKKEESDLENTQTELKSLATEQVAEKVSKFQAPARFYMASIFAAYLFVIYISIFATLHFEDIEFMNITIVFIFISMVSFFLISMIYFISEKKKLHAAAPAVFFLGIVAIMVYAFKAVDTTDLVRFSIIYTIIVVAVSAYVLAIKR